MKAMFEYTRPTYVPLYISGRHFAPPPALAQGRPSGAQEGRQQISPAIETRGL